jgi:hypothetical protein
MIAPIPPALLYGIWDPEGGDDRRGDWMKACDSEVPEETTPLLAFRSRVEAEAAARRLMRSHSAFMGREMHYVVESMIGAPASARASFAGRN